MSLAIGPRLHSARRTVHQDQLATVGPFDKPVEEASTRCFHSTETPLINGIYLFVDLGPQLHL